MEIQVARMEGNPPVTILRLQGNLDGSNYKELISSGVAQYELGTRRLLIDMSEIGFMSSAGMVALHSLVLVFRGEPMPDLESGWGALRSIDRETETGKQPFVKLLNPQPRILNTLKMSGMDMFIDIFSDEQAALQSFSS